jgi:ankyrin repeat protein
MLNHGADVNAQEDDKWTPLHLAAFKKHLEFTRLLLEQYARDDFGKTPSDKARSREILKLLAEYGNRSESG